MDNANIYRTDPTRIGSEDELTGIYVRAQRDGSWGSYDIAWLDKDSLRAWLRSRGGENEWAEGVVLMLLGHSVFPPLPSASGDRNG